MVLLPRPKHKEKTEVLVQYYEFYEARRYGSKYGGLQAIARIEAEDRVQIRYEWLLRVEEYRVQLAVLC